MKLNIKIGQLAKYIEEYKDIKLLHNEEVNIKDLRCQINIPFGLTTINYIIKKENLIGLKIILKNNIEVKCATKHILRSNDKDIFADGLIIGNCVDTREGPVEIIEIMTIDDTTFYDIGIDAPHLYYDSDGVLHHNTLITAALSKMSEKYGRSIVIVPNRDLVTQTEADYINLGLDVGVFYGGRNEWDKTHTICTWQSLDRLDKKTKDHLTEEEIGKFLEDVQCIMVDECLAGETNISMADGTSKQIKDIQMGEKIINYDEKTKQFNEDIVEDVYNNMSNSSKEKMYRLEFDNGTMLEATGNHKILTTNGMIRVDKLTKSDEIIGRYS